MNPLRPTASRKPSLLVALAIALASTGTLLICAADVQARERSTSATGKNGQTGQRSVARSEGDVNSSTAGPTGKTASRNVDRSASGTTATETGPNGKSASRVTTRTDTGSQTTVTGPNGQTGSATVTHP